jgi:hypothetical protein|nr:MAG TPA: Oxaloacetate decarboxylase, gamma chain [Caudoviricetes sp.]
MEGKMFLIFIVGFVQFIVFLIVLEIIFRGVKKVYSEKN